MDTTGVSLNSFGSVNQGGLLKGDALFSSSRRTRGLVGVEGARRIKEQETGEKTRSHEDCQRVMCLWGVRELSQRPEHTKCRFNPEGKGRPWKEKKSRVFQVCRMSAGSSQVRLYKHTPSWDVPPSGSLSWPGLWRKTDLSSTPALSLV